MSHVTSIDLHVTDLDALAKAAKSVGCALSLGQTTIQTYQDGIQCEHAIFVAGDPRAYEAAVVRRADGKGWEIKLDNYGAAGRALEAKLGIGAVRLRQCYAAQVSRKIMAKQGYRVTIKEDAGKLRVRCVR